ncbi:MAG TPA: hypothetical protein EYP85_11100 [Armatimonadetes bacterium]|nr:hypothetical protein [Armatimonadota bacterium]
MGVDYVINFNCAPKRALGTEQILGLLKDRARARAVREFYRRQTGEEAPDDLTFLFRLTTPEGVQEVPLTLADLEARTVVLNEHETACRGCPANLRHRPFGCFGYLDYPLSQAGEEWLMSCLPDDWGSGEAQLLRTYLQGFQVTGAYAQRLRASGQMFFEAPAPVVREWEGKEGPVTITSDQIFDVLFGREAFHPSYALVFCVIFGAMQVGLPLPEDFDQSPYELATVITDEEGGHSLAAFIWSTEEEEEATVAGLKQYFKAMCLAYCLSVELLVGS